MIDLTDASFYLDKEIGLDGTPERMSFKNEAYSYYFGEILKNRRKELKLSQEELADRVGNKDHIYRESKTEKTLEFPILFRLHKL
jgi:ribosome-binding protein aMBF1 (putative translation factor)